MKDEQLIAVCFWIAAYAALASVASILLPSLRFILLPSTVFVGATAVLLFLRMLFSRTYRRGVDAANREMQGNDPWPGRPKKFLDPEWGIFGSRGGPPALLRLRAVFFFGSYPIAVLQTWAGIEVVWLWFAGFFVAMALTVMYLALSQPR